MSLPLIQVVVVKPEGFLHSGTFAELAETLLEGLTALGVETRLVENDFDAETANLVLGWHLLTERQESGLPAQCILYNLEQLSDENEELCSRLIQLSSQCELWDYSLRNIDILHQAGLRVPVQHVPIGTMPAMTRIPSASVQDIDVLFYGSGSKRRAKIIEELKSAGLRVEWAFGLYGSARDALISRAKVVLNMHYYDTKIFEMVRVSYLWANKKAVVSECEAGTELEEGLEDAAKFVPYEGLVDACRELVADEASRKQLEERGHRAMSARLETDVLSRVLAGEAEVLPPRGTGTPRLSLAVCTRNDELSLPGLLASCQGVDEVVVVDLGSTDHTLEIARRGGARILRLPGADHVTSGRAQALDAASGDWVLALDVRERVPPGAITRLRALATSAPPEVAGYSLEFHVCLGRIRVHATAPGWGHPHRQSRFFRRGLATWPLGQVGPGVEGQVIDLPGGETWIDWPVDTGLEQLFDRMNQDSTAESRAMLDAGTAPAILSGLQEGLSELAHGYAPEADGALSLALGLGVMAHRVATHAKLSEALGWPQETVPSKAAMARAVEAFSECLLADGVSTRPRGAEEAPPMASIIIPVFNKVEYTRNCLERLQASPPRHRAEIIVIDNGSSDGTGAFLAGMGERIRVISNTENLGFVEACNLGAAASRGSYLVFLNNDTTPEPGWLDALVEMLERDAGIGAAGARLVYPDGRLQEAGGLIFNDASGWNFGRFEDPSLPIFSEPCEVDYCSGAALMVRRELFERLGGFDLRYAPAYYEDTDLCFGIRSLGYRVMYCPFSTVIHFEGVTAGTDLSTGYKRYQSINREKFATKWATALACQDPPPGQTGFNPVTADRRRLQKASPEPLEDMILPPPAADAFHVLVVDPFLPIHDQASGSLRLFRIVQLFRALGCRVTYIARNGSHEKRYREELELFGVRVFAGDPEKMALLGYATDAPRVDLERLLSESPCDLAWLSFYDLAEQYLPDIRRISPATVIAVDTVDVHFLRERRQAELAGDALGLQRAEATQRRELAIYGQADRVITVTGADADVLHQAGLLAPTVVVPNIHTQVEDTQGWPARRDFVFVGNFNHTPNTDAALWLGREIMPRIRALLPGAQCDIVGPNPPEAVLDLAGAGISVLGWVPDTAPYLDKARVSLAPLRVGAGMKGKVGEALSRGLPVVTTAIGAEGMGLEDGVHLLIAEDADRFAEAAVRLHEDSGLWGRLVAAGRRFVDDRYGMEGTANLLFDAFLAQDKASETES